MSIDLQSCIFMQTVIYIHLATFGGQIYICESESNNKKRLLSDVFLRQKDTVF